MVLMTCIIITEIETRLSNDEEQRQSPRRSLHSTCDKLMHKSSLWLWIDIQVSRVQPGAWVFCLLHTTWSTKNVQMSVT